MNTTPRAVRIGVIQVGDRYRKNLGDVRSLADSIEEIGLLHPIVVTPDWRLVAGHRRLEALKLLNREEVPVTIVEGLDDARLMLVAEQDENTCREEMRTAEKVALGLAIEGLERPKAEERRVSSLKQGINPPRADKKSERARGRVREIVGSAIGMSGTTYHQAKTVVRAARDETLDPKVRTVAQEALAEMDRTGKIQPAYDKVRRAVTDAPEPKGNGKSRVHTKTYRGRNALAGIRRTIDTLIGLASGLDGVSVSDAKPEPDEARAMERDLAGVGSTINRFREQLKEHANG